MSKIRINELARQLEVPSHAIIDMLPELGVSEKKTHSSSIDEPVAEIIRQRVQGGAGAAMRREPDASVAVAEPIHRHEQQPARHEQQPARHEQQPARHEPSAPPALENHAHALKVPIPEFEAPAPASTAGPAQEAPVTPPS